MKLKSEVLDSVSGSHLSRLPELAISISQFDLHEEIRLLPFAISAHKACG